MRSQNRRRDSGSTPEVGSSRNRIGGRCSTAQPSARRCFQPPARVADQRVLAAVSPAMSDREARCARRASRRWHAVDAAEEAQVLGHRQVAVEREFLRHVADALRARASGFCATSMPATMARPPLGRSRPHRMRMVVDLPAPLGPRKPMISPRAMSKLTLVDGDEVAEALDQAFGDNWSGCRCARHCRPITRALRLERARRTVFDARRLDRRCR